MIAEPFPRHLSTKFSIYRESLRNTTEIAGEMTKAAGQVV
jgi:hypothetical protein